MSSIKWFSRYVWRFKKGFFLATLYLLLATLFGVAVTAAQKIVIDDVFTDGRYELLPWLLLGFGAAIGCATLFGVLWTHTGRVYAYRIYGDLTSEAMRAIYRTPASVYHNERIARYVGYFTNDINWTTVALTQFVPNGISNLLTALAISVIIGWTSPTLLLGILAFCLLYLALGNRFGGRIRTMSKQVQEAKSNFLVHMEEGVSSTREVIAFHREEWERQKVNDNFAVFYEKVMEEGKLENRKLAWSDPLRWGATLIVLGYGGYLVMQDALSIGMYVVIFQFTSQLMNAINDVYGFAMEAQGRLAMVDRIKALLEGPQVAEGDRELEGPIRSLELGGISFRYSETTRTVLDQLSLRIPVGKKVAFVGPSGGGKSTIAQLLVQFYDPQEGRILVNGIPLTELRRASWMGRLSVVFQDPYLFPESIRNNVLMGREKSEQELTAACEQACIHEFVQSLAKGYDTELGERGINLSGGQKQRLALARAIIQRSEILILDESTSSLDLETERQVQKQIDELRAGLTTIIIAHRLSTVENADVIFVMDQGRIAEQGTHAELMASDTLYKKLVFMQMEAEAG
ncbi:ABC transporter ATP-binding protein [Paenibacillus koleovorans]|uniref:ABC transporter ATP-binding protein n=1 Tax=Paenibacillus koleovorans TaxID=121608 RepID=UPI000FD6F9F1|nr:ABC transporter ATP-binding protein [Paenibacillus koleovorans]